MTTYILCLRLGDENDDGEIEYTNVRDEYMTVFAIAFWHSVGSIILTLLVWWKVDVQSGGYVG